ncbi:hypothetical protein [Candidatus Cetobacterium colombiensis]|uniref:Uncharacterized protein n=1 Tax=Candidatus Cetobacterium colombiensis TaxID=3073100 RepID=A0ABU4WD22_9FUSO|nr:hypothetical protein [Candidatus Cetobacterium colombiensis]MDX8337421.1 hypothetical protein [Candidatus Cetobacterium colombiensis]
MSKVRLEIKNMLQSSIDKTNVNKEEHNYKIDSIVNLDLIKSLTDDKEITDMLISKTSSLINLQIKNALSLGEIFTSVFEKLSKSGSKYDGLYEKWLQLNGINKKTALRYRKRYELYLLVKNKESIAIMPQKYIDILYSEEDKTKYINNINNGATCEEIVNLLKDKTEISKIEEYSNTTDFDFKNYSTLFVDFNRKIETLKEKEKIELQKYLEKINKILNK